MAFESRRLIFSQDELISAALDFCRHDRIALPDAEVEGVEFVSNAEPSLILLFRVKRPMDQDQVVLLGTAADQRSRPVLQEHGDSLATIVRETGVLRKRQDHAAI